MKNLNYFIFTLLVVFLVSCKDKKAVEPAAPASVPVAAPAVSPPTPCPGNEHGRSTLIINVYRQGNGEVKLSSRGNANVKPCTYIQWNVVGSAEIDRIEIRPEIRDNQTDIWEESPQEIGGSKNWRGLVFNGTGSEYYYLDYWKNGDTTKYTIDPVIKVDPNP